MKVGVRRGKSPGEGGEYVFRRRKLMGIEYFESGTWRTLRRGKGRWVERLRERLTVRRKIV